MSAKHNLKFMEAAILHLRSEIISDIALLETLLKDPTAASTHPNLVMDITEIARRCVANEQTSSFLKKNIPSSSPSNIPLPPVIVEEEADDGSPGPVGTPPSQHYKPALTEKELRKRSPTFRKSINKSPKPPTEKDEKE